MYCHLYRSFERFRRAELLDAAKAGTLSYPHLLRSFSGSFIQWM